MRVVLLLAFVARVAAASPFVDGRVSMRLPDGDTLKVVVTSTSVAPTENVRDVLAADPVLAGVKIERLAHVRDAIAFIAVPALPHHLQGRVMIAAVDALARDGTLVSVRFYIASTERAAQWAAVARKAAETLQVVVDPAPPLVHSEEPTLPKGWGLRSDTLYTVITSPHGECRVIDGELDVRATAPASARKVPGEVWGDTVYWSTWSDADGEHAELLTGAKHWGMLHATCLATTRSASFQLRKAVEAKFP